MAKQDDYVRITLRLPPALHQALSEQAGAKSMNAYIVEILDEYVQIDRSRTLSYEAKGYVESGMAESLEARIYEATREAIKNVLEQEGLRLTSSEPGFAIVTEHKD